MNLINEVDKPKVTKTVVIYAGRFQPFHKGHFDAYNRLCSKFGSSNVYIGTSDDQSGPKSPFAFRDKKEIATKMFGIPSSHFIKVNNPYRPVEILKKFDGKTTQYIAAVGEKDADRLSGKYFKPYNGKAGYGYDEIGYVYPVPAEANPISGTDVRKGLGSDDKEKAKKFFLKAYPKFDKDIFKMIKNKLNEWGTGNPAGMAGSLDKLNIIDKDDEKNEGFPGGIGTGLNLPGGYINGAPTGSNESIAEQALADFLKEYFTLNEDDSMGDPSGGPGYTSDGVLDDQLFRSPYLPGWEAFDNNGQNYASIVGYTVLGHTGADHQAKTGNIKLPVQNPRDENGEMHRVIHPSKGEDYAKEKANSWEMYPFNQRQQNFFKTPDVENGAASKSNMVNEEDLYDPISNILSNVISEEIFNEWLDGYFGEDANAALDKDITYTNSKGQQKKIRARDALRLPKDHPAHIQAARIAGPDDAPANEPKKKEEPGKAAQAAAKPAQPGQPTKQGHTAQGKADKETPAAGGEAGEQGPPPEQKLSGAELVSPAEKTAEKEKNGQTEKHIGKRIHGKIKNWSKEEKEHFTKLLNKKEGHDERRSWGQAIMDKAKGAGHAIMHGLKHEAQEFKMAGQGVAKLMSGGKLDHHDKKAMLSVGKKIAMTAVMGAVGGGLAHGAAAFAKHVAMELVPHAVSEVVATGVGKAAMFAEGINDATALNIFAGAIAERMENMKLTPEMIEGIVDSWNNKKMINKFSLNESMSEAKKNSINDFVNFATERLKLQERPKITLLSGNEYSNEQSSLGGYNPETKEIYVQTENRLGADILRTIAHEMVHRKQDEIGLITDPLAAGKDGSPIENQAHAVAGILMREYGRKNKQIYQEGFVSNAQKEMVTHLIKAKDNFEKALRYTKSTQEKKNITKQLDDIDKLIKNLVSAKSLSEIQKILEDINLDVDKGDTILMGKFKNKKVDVKSIGKDDHGMPTINGKQATTFRTTNEELILEGGAYGHMSHPFDDMDLTFGDLKNIITKALNGDLGVVREKTDGQALAISWKKGRLIAARNKSHLANAGANAMGIEGVSSKFSGRGGLTDAYNFAMKDLTSAISSLSQKQREKIFGEGSKFMNIEVIWPTSVNVIPYGQALLVFHNCIEYDKGGNAIGKVDGAENVLAGMIKQVNADVQSKYTIQGPPITSIPKNDDLSSKQGKYLSKLQKLQSEFALSDGATLAEYHQAYWDSYITENSPVKIDKITKDALIRRWAFGDKSFRLNTITNKDLQKWAIDHDKVNVPQKQKDNMKPFEEIFLGVGADVLEFVSSVLTVHPDKAIRAMKEKFKSVASQVRSGGDPSKIAKLKSELSRLNQLGGIDRIVASEGLVFFYNGKTYKLTGTFAPLNQILGIFYA